MSGGDFARIAGTVDELAFQTKLLALNAAFEAARSQEQGRSLARLAVEMSRLVDRTSRSNRSIVSSPVISGRSSLIAVGRRSIACVAR